MINKFPAGTLDEHMHLLLPALIRLFKVDASLDVRRRAINTLTKLIPRVQVGYYSELLYSRPTNLFEVEGI